MKIKKGDQVKISSGKDRDKTGKVLSIFPKKNKLIVEGINIIKKHVRPKKGGEKGQRIEKSAPLPISNVMLLCPHCSKTVRAGYRFENQKKIRICKKCANEMN